MLDDLLEKGNFSLPEPKIHQEVRRIVKPKYCRYHRVVSHPVKKCIMLKEWIIQLAKDGRIILSLGDMVETNHISSQLECLSPPWQQKYTYPHHGVYTKGISFQRGELFTIQFSNLKPIVLHKHGLPNSFTQEEFLAVSFFGKTMVNMASCFVVEEKMDEEDGRQESFLRETDKTLAALEAILMHLN